MDGGGGNGPARLEGEGAEPEGANVHGVLDELRLVLFERHLAEVLDTGDGEQTQTEGT